MVLFDATFIEDCVKAKTSNNQRVLADIQHFSREYSNAKVFPIDE